MQGGPGQQMVGAGGQMQTLSTPTNFQLQMSQQHIQNASGDPAGFRDVGFQQANSHRDQF